MEVQSGPGNGPPLRALTPNLNGQNTKPPARAQPTPSNNINGVANHVSVPSVQQNRGSGTMQNSAAPMQRPLPNKVQPQNPVPQAQRPFPVPQAVQMAPGQQRQPANDTSNNSPGPQRQPATTNNSHNNPPGAQNTNSHSATETAIGFYTARVAETVQSGAAPPTKAASFNPRLESPSIRKTDGFDHSNSKPISRDTVAPSGAAPP